MTKAEWDAMRVVNRERAWVVWMLATRLAIPLQKTRRMTSTETKVHLIWSWHYRELFLSPCRYRTGDNG